MNKTYKILIGIVSTILVLIIGFVVYYNMNLSAVSKSDEQVIVTIESGSSQYAALDALEDAGLIKNKTVAKVYLKLHPMDNLQANTYILNKNMDLKEMLSILENPSFENILKSKLTIPEGTRLVDIVDIIADNTGLKSKDILKKWSNKDYLKTLIKDYDMLSDEILDEDIKYPLEGYLYPETYYITEQEEDIDHITRTLLDMTQTKINGLQSSIDKMGYTVHEFLTLSSIVECESLFDEDKPIIAGVFINRLNKDMALQSDITVNYALNKTGVKVSYKQLETDSKYNTYKYKGLPVGPVSNVCVDTMNAVVNYTKSDYLFFFAKEDGTVIYSKTVSEHEKAVEKYRWY